jgi:sugar (pentulose or hexulose) kinase
MASSAATSPEGEAGLEADDAPLFLGLDFGTSGARGTVVDSQGGIVHELAAAYPPIVGGGKGGDGVPEGGWVEAWRGALWALLDKLPRTVAAQITAVSVDGTSGTVLIVDAVTGEPLCAPMLYNEKRADAMPAVEAMAPEGHTVRSATSALCKLHSWWVSNGSNSSSSGDSSLASDRQLGTTQPITGVALDGDRQLSTTQPTSGSGVGARLLHHADWVAFLLHGEMGISDHNNALKLGFDPGAGVDGKGAYPPWLLAAPYADMLPSRVLPPGTAAAAVSSVSGLARLGTGTGKKVSLNPKP